MDRKSDDLNAEQKSAIFCMIVFGGAGLAGLLVGDPEVRNLGWIGIAIAAAFGIALLIAEDWKETNGG